MLKDVTIGQYYSVDSVIHDLDPRVKLRFILVMIILLMIDRNIFLFSIFSILFVILMLLSRIPVRHIIRGTGKIVMLFAICSAINIFTTPSVDTIFLSVSKDGIIKAALVFWRMVIILYTSSLLMYTTTPSEITDGLEKGFHVSGNVAMAITIALRYVGIIFEELDRITKAMEARGAQLKGGNIKIKLKNIKLIAVPLFQNSINKATTLGDAMDAKCYTGGKERTKYRPLVYDKNDLLAYLIMLAIIVGAVYIIIQF